MLRALVCSIKTNTFGKSIFSSKHSSNESILVSSVVGYCCQIVRNHWFDTPKISVFVIFQISIFGGNSPYSPFSYDTRYMLDGPIGVGVSHFFGFLHNL